MSNLTPAQRAELERRNLEHVPVYCMVLTPTDVADLLEGRVNDQVRAMAGWLAESLEEVLARKAAERKPQRRGGARQ